MNLKEREIAVCGRYGLTIALTSDLHGSKPESALSMLKAKRPDIIAAPGDIFEMRNGLSDKEKAKINKAGYEFLEEAAKIAPVFYSLGNHDAFPTEKEREKITNTGAVFLDNRYVSFKGINIGGLSSGGSNRYFKTTHEPDLSFIKSFDKLDGFKLLLNHHPEYYEKYIKDTGIDLTLSGHAHGGQWIILGKSIFAPGQGLFPKYTNGIYENRLIVSRGMGGLTKVPRIGNPPEIIFIKI